MKVSSKRICVCALAIIDTLRGIEYERDDIPEAGISPENIMFLGVTGD